MTNMFLDTLMQDLSLPSIVGIFLLLLIPLMWFRFKRSNTERSHRIRLIPTAPTGIIQTIRAFSGKDSPYFMLEQATTLDSWIFKLPLPGSFYVIGNTEIQRKILTSTGAPEKSTELYTTGKAMWGGTHNMLTSPNNTYWRNLRKTVNHAFAPKHLVYMKASCEKHLEKWIQTKLEPMVGDPTQSFDPRHEMIHLTFQIICDVAFDYEVTEQEIDDFANNYKVGVLEFAFRQSVEPWRKLAGRLLPEVRRAHKAATDMQDLCRRIIAKYRKKYPNGCKDKDPLDYSILDILMTHSHIDSDKQRIGEIWAFLSAGHDTTSSTISFNLLNLATNPDCAKQLTAELKEHGESSQYLQKNFKESNRITPASSIVTCRTTKKDLEVPIGNDEKNTQTGIIPSGSAIFISQYAANHNPHVFNEPSKFDPLRWDDASLLKHSPLTFSAGLRSCVGQKLARVQSSTFVSRLCKDYTFEVAEEGSYQSFGIFQPIGYQLRIQRNVN